MPRLEFRREERTDEQEQLDGLFEKLAHDRERDGEREGGKDNAEQDAQLDGLFKSLALERERKGEREVLELYSAPEPPDEDVQLDQLLEMLAREREGGREEGEHSSSLEPGRGSPVVS